MENLEKSPESKEQFLDPTIGGASLKFLDLTKGTHKIYVSKVDKEDPMQWSMSTNQGENKVQITLLDKSEETYLVTDQYILKSEAHSVSKQVLVAMLEKMTHNMWWTIQKKRNNPQHTFKTPDDFIQKVCATIYGFPEKKKKDDPLNGLSIAAMIESQGKHETIFVQPTRVTERVTEERIAIEMTPEEEVRVLEAAKQFFSED